MKIHSSQDSSELEAARARIARALGALPDPEFFETLMSYERLVREDERSKVLAAIKDRTLEYEP